jgi:hypothetical protein
VAAHLAEPVRSITFRSRRRISHGFIEKFKKHGLDWREFNVREAGPWQLFVYDPSGVQLEITFDADKENGPEPDMKNHGYVAGSSFFKEPTPA